MQSKEKMKLNLKNLIEFFSWRSMKRGDKWEWSWLGVSCSWVGYRRLQAAGNQPKEETSPTNGMSFFFFFSNSMNGDEIELTKRNKEMKLKKEKRAKCWNGMEWIYLRSLMAKQINERQWNESKERVGPPPKESWMSGVGFISLLSLFVGYGLLRQPMLRKEKRQAKREMKSMKWMKLPTPCPKQINFIPFTHSINFFLTG